MSKTTQKEFAKLINDKYRKEGNTNKGFKAILDAYRGHEEELNGTYVLTNIIHIITHTCHCMLSSIWWMICCVCHVWSYMIHIRHLDIRRRQIGRDTIKRQFRVWEYQRGVWRRPYSVVVCIARDHIVLLWTFEWGILLENGSLWWISCQAVQEKRQRKRKRQEMRWETVAHL